MRQYSIPSRSIHLAVFLAVLGGAICPAAVKYENSLRRVTATPAGGNLIVAMDAIGEYRYEQFELINPKRLVIDLIQLNNEVKTGRIPVVDRTETVKDITVAQFRAKNPAITRVTMTLGNHAGGYNVVRSGSQMRVVFKREMDNLPPADLQKPKEAIPVAKVPQVTQKIVPSTMDASAEQAVALSAEKAKMDTASSSRPPIDNKAPVPSVSAQKSQSTTSTAESTVPEQGAAAKPPSQPGHFQLASMQPNPRRIRVLPAIQNKSGSVEKNAVSVEKSRPEAVSPTPSQASLNNKAEQSPEATAVKQSSLPATTPTSKPSTSENNPSLLPVTTSKPSPLSGPTLPSPSSTIASEQLKPVVSAEAAPKSPLFDGKNIDSSLPVTAKIEQAAPPAPKPETAEKKAAVLEEAPVKVINASIPPPSNTPDKQLVAASAASNATISADGAKENPVITSRVPLAKSPEEALASTFASQTVLPTKNAATSPNSKPLITRAKGPSTIITKPGIGSRQPVPPAAGSKPSGGAARPEVPGTAEIKVSQPGGGKSIQASSTQYIGEEIDLKVKDLDLVDFFRMMSEISGLNISVDPDVAGKITMQMNAVPWDQIFDLALSTHKLERKIEGNVVRVSRKQTLQDEEKAIQSLKEAQLNSLEPQTTTVKLNYSDAEQVMTTMEKQLSSKGTIFADKRTNTLIITDIPPRLQSLTQLVHNLDTPEKQVRIEARVVQATRNFAQEIGVNLGFLAGYGERVTAGGPPVRTSSIPWMNQNVNLGAVRNNGQIGIKIGSIMDTFQLDAAIQAGEQRGLAKLISRPSVSGQNNREAVIRQGVRFPIQTIQNNTISVQYQDASLTLRVTPLITHENTILMKLKVENNVADFTRMVNGIPSIKTNESDTAVLVADGGTTVIGGILIDDDRKTTDSVPGLSSIPIFGNLFKKRSLEKRTEEVLFFITPTISQ